MPKTKISEYSQTAASNTDINSINLAEGMLPSDVNNAIRELMKQLKDFQVGAGGDPVTIGGNLVVSGTTKLSGINYPSADGTNGQFLKTNGSGSLSFDTVPAGSSLDGDTDSATPFETSLGNGAGAVNTGVNNTFVGFEAGNDNTTGANNVAVGYQAMDVNTTGYENVGIGSGALGANTTGFDNVAIGYNALLVNTTGANNTAVGAASLDANTIGVYNTAVGSFALTSNTTGSYNTAVGQSALNSNTTGSNNGAFGSDTGGYSPLWSNTTGSNNNAFGNAALSRNTTGSNNSAFGHLALLANTTGANNTAVGYAALDACTTGSDNVAVGYNALTEATTADRNVAVGSGAASATTTGYYNTSIGTSAGNSITTGTYNSSIGYNAQPSSAGASGDFTLGDGNVSNLRCNDTTISSLSDQRDKTDIVDSPYGLAFINKVKPRQFKWQTREGNVKDGSTRLGFIAQELFAATDGKNDILDLVMDNNPEKLEAKSGNLLPIMVKAIQELSAKCDALQAEVNQLKGN